MGVSIGIDVGLQGVKVAVLEGTARAPRILAFHHHKLEGGQTTRALPAADLADLLRRIVAERRIPAGNVVAAIPATSCLTRETSVPFNRPEHIRKVIKGQAEAVFHAVSIDDVVVDFYKLADQGERSRILVIGVKKDVLRERLEPLEMAELDPSALDLDAAALFAALSLTPAVKEGKRVLGVDLGGSSMKMVAIEGGALRGIRSTRLQAAQIKVGERRSRESGRASHGPMSLEALKRSVAESGERESFFAEQDEAPLPVVILDDDQAEVFDFASAPEAERQSALDKVFLEIDRTLAATHLEGPVDVVYLTGGGAAVEGLERAFAEHFAARCERVRFEGAVQGRLDPRSAEALDLAGAVALGLALKGLGFDPAGLDFRQEEFAYQGRFERAKRGIACALVLAFVLFFVTAYKFQQVEMSRLGQKRDRVVRYAYDVYTTLFPEDQYKEIEDYVVALRAKEGELKRRLKGFDVPDVVSALDVMRDVAQGFEESGKKALLKDMVLKQGRTSSSMTIEVDDESTVYAIKAAVNAKPRLVTVEESKIQPDPKSGKVIAQLRLILREEEKKRPVRPGGGE